MYRKLSSLILCAALLFTFGFRARNTIIHEPLNQANTPALYKGYQEPQYKELTITSLYLTMRDGVKIAIDLALPKGLAAGARIPTVVQLTRYWRARQGQAAGDLQKFFTSYGYAFVSVDVRGTGASFGTWPMPWSRDEIKDGGEIVDWIVKQVWSNGKVGAVGNSYSGTTAQMLAVPNHPAVKAVIPRHYEYDVYTDVAFPGGVFNRWMNKMWNDGNHQLDLSVGVKPVDADTDGSMRKAAIESHKNNIDLYKASEMITYRDDRPFNDASIEDFSVYNFRKEIESSGVAIYNWGSWLDAGTADALIHSFLTLKNRQRTVIGAWNHGASQNASPYLSSASQSIMQRFEWLRFFDYHLKGLDTGLDEEKVLFYYTMGEEKWKATQSWPPAGVTNLRFYMADGNSLSRTRPESGQAADSYKVDFEATTGEKNRWRTQLGGPVIYPDRAEEDRRLLVYTSEPLEQDTEITGYPVINLFVTTTGKDGAFFAYLEDVAESGKVTYITEGQLRAIHRKVSESGKPYKTVAPYHSFKRKDAMPVQPGQVMEIKFGLLPTSVLIKKGHRLRIAIAGHDKSVFAPVPPDATPTISVHRNSRRASFIDLPVVTAQSRTNAPVNILIAPVAKTSTAKPAEAMASVDQILDRYAQAIGGRDAIEKVTSRIMKGTQESPSGSILTVERYDKAPNRSLSVVTSPDGTTLSGFDGTTGWAQPQGEAPREVSTPERLRNPRIFVIHREVRLKEIYSSLTLRGIERVGNRDAYLVEAAPAEGNPVKLYFDKETGLLIRRDTRRQAIIQKTEDGVRGEAEIKMIDIETYYDDYKEVDGVRMPFTIRENMPAGSFTTTYTEIKLNAPIDDSKFNMPAKR